MIKPDLEYEGQEYFLVETIANYLDVSQRLVIYWCQQDHLGAIRFANYRWIIPVSMILDHNGHWKWLPPQWSVLSDNPLSKRITGLIYDGLAKQEDRD